MNYSMWIHMTLFFALYPVCAGHVRHSLARLFLAKTNQAFDAYSTIELISWLNFNLKYSMAACHPLHESAWETFAEWFQLCCQAIHPASHHWEGGACTYLVVGDILSWLCVQGTARVPRPHVQGAPWSSNNGCFVCTCSTVTSHGFPSLVWPDQLP